MADVRSVCTALLDEVNLPTEAARTQYSPLPTHTSQLISATQTFKKKTEDILRHEKARQVLRRAGRAGKAEKVVETSKLLTNGYSESKPVTQLTATPGENKLVLTLYGNAPGPKQLFSSLQEPANIDGGRKDVSGPLREAGLPNGISTTQIVPIQATGLVEDKKTVPKLGELFSTSSLLPFNPPKPSRHTARGSAVGWYLPGQPDTSRLQGTQCYHGMQISVGQWLDYYATSTGPKQKLQEHAVSLGNIKPIVPDEEEDESAKLETLFQNAYSSFAPTRDDTAALVPECQLNRIWWQKVGERSFDRFVHNTINMSSAIGAEASTSKPEVTDEEMRSFEEAVSHWDEQLVDPALQDEGVKSIEDKDVEEIQLEVSELLEALNSYQRNRFLSRQPDEAGKPTEAETATYNTLKAQLSLMIAMLPPYAVAKLDGDQLKELNISTKIPILTDTFRGVMEEDEEAQRAKVAELAANRARSGQSPSTHRTSASLYGNQYASTSRSSVPTSQYYATQTPIRPPSTNSSRAPVTAPVPYVQRQSSGASYRPQPGYAGPTYPHQLPRSNQPAYVPPSTQYYQTPTQSFGQQAYGAQTVAGNRYQAPPNASYLSRQPSATNGLYSNGVAARQPSPQKGQPYSPQPTTVQPSRPYGTPTPSVSQDRRYQSSIPNGAIASPQPQTPQTTAALGATGYHTVMTPAEQSTMMERQRAQLAQQQGTQLQARTAAQAGTLTVSGST